jgi:hypothetical protein
VKHPSLEELNAVLVKKGARLTISVADACNKPTPPPPAQRPAPTPAALKILFGQFAGNIVLSSSKRGQLSWYYDRGGIFTDQFIASMRNAPNAEPLKLWEKVASAATKQLKVRIKGETIYQDPQAQFMDLRYIGAQ